MLFEILRQFLHVAEIAESVIAHKWDSLVAKSDELNVDFENLQ